MRPTRNYASPYAGSYFKKDMMYDFDKFLAFCQHFNPSHKFTNEETQFLRGEFEDLKTFIEELGKQGDKKRVEFEDVLQDEIFYHNDNCWVKINEEEGRKFQGRGARTFGKLTEVEINSG
jgi:hypothetical protein